MAPRDVEAQEPLLNGENAEVHGDVEAGGCEAGTWSRPPARVAASARAAGEAVAGSAGKDERERLDAGGLAASIATLLFSLPALVGSWCWPLLLAGILGVTASAGAKAFSHNLSFAITLTALTNLAQYTYWKALGRRGSHWQRFGPVYLACAAVPLVMADLTRHVLQDAGFWPSPGSDMYRPGCDRSVSNLGGITCLTPIGVLFSLVFTYAGFICLIAGVVWGADLVPKVRAAWRDVKRAARPQQP